MPLRLLAVLALGLLAACQPPAPAASPNPTEVAADQVEAAAAPLPATGGL